MCVGMGSATEVYVKDRMLGDIGAEKRTFIL